MSDEKCPFCEPTEGCQFCDDTPKPVKVELELDESQALFLARLSAKTKLSRDELIRRSLTLLQAQQNETLVNIKYAFGADVRVIVATLIEHLADKAKTPHEREQLLYRAKQAGEGGPLAIVNGPNDGLWIPDVVIKL